MTKDGKPLVRTGYSVKKAPAVLVFLLAACCPDPRPVDGGAAGTDGVSSGSAKLSTVQSQIFDRHCVTDCHEAGNAAADLRLTAGKSHGSLVNVTSQQLASQIRVIPTDADRSYLIRKLEGGPGIVGDQMPRLAPPRPQADLDLVRSWVSRGAPND